MALAWICRMITNIQKYKNDNLFSDQVLVLLMFSNGRELYLNANNSLNLGPNIT